VQAGENAVIAGDADKGTIAHVVARMACEHDAEAVVIVMTPRSAHGEEPPTPVGAAADRADVIHMVTNCSLLHDGKARRSAVAAGAR